MVDNGETDASAASNAQCPPLVIQFARLDQMRELLVVAAKHDEQSRVAGIARATRSSARLQCLTNVGT